MVCVGGPHLKILQFPGLLPCPPGGPIRLGSLSTSCGVQPPHPSVGSRPGGSAFERPGWRPRSRSSTPVPPSQLGGRFAVLPATKPRCLVRCLGTVNGPKSEKKHGSAWQEEVGVGPAYGFLSSVGGSGRFNFHILSPAPPIQEGCWMANGVPESRC